MVAIRRTPSRRFAKKAQDLSKQIDKINLIIIKTQEKGVVDKIGFGSRRIDKKVKKALESATNLFKEHKNPKVRAHSKTAAFLFVGLIQDGVGVQKALREVEENVKDMPSAKKGT